MHLETKRPRWETPIYWLYGEKVFYRPSHGQDERIPRYTCSRRSVHGVLPWSLEEVVQWDIGAISTQDVGCYKAFSARLHSRQSILLHEDD